MMKRIKRAFTLFLSALLLTSSVAACKGNETTSEEQGGTAILTEGRVEKATPTENYFVQKAKSDYKIVLSDSAPEVVRLAANEFNYFFKQSTGFALDVISDAGLTFDNNSKYLSLGDTRLSSQAKVSYDMGKYDGYTVQTEGKSIFVDGDNYGVLYGVYKTLYYLINYEYFSPNAYNMRKNVSEIKLVDFDIKQFPDYRNRQGDWGSVSASTEVMNRLMLTTEPIMLMVGSGGHNSMDYIPKEKYLNPDDEANYHSEWYMQGADPTQLCYTARGNAASLDAMLAACLETLKAALINNPVGTVASFSVSDDHNWCNCDACAASIQKYGTQTGSVIQFLNKFTEMIYDWFETPEGQPYKRDLKILFYAYISLEVPPVNYNEQTGEYTPIDDTVVCNEYVLPQLCMTNTSYIQTLSTGSMNAAARKSIAGWGAVCKNMWAYMYNTDYYNYMVPHSTFSSMQDWYQSYKKAGAIGMHNLGQGNEYGMSTGFSNLKIYLDAQLKWNVNADYQGLIDRFFKGVYLDGAEDMQKIFDEMRVLTQYNAIVHQKEFLTTNINGNRGVKKAKFWPLNKLTEWRELISVALEKIEHLQTSDPVAYAMAHKYIVCERIWIDHLLYQIYEGTMSSAALTELKDEHYNDLVYCGVQREWQNVSIESYLKALKA